MPPDRDPLLPPEDNPFWKELGITPNFSDEANAPPVDKDVLRRYCRDELDEAACDEVHRLAGRFRSWYIALGETARDGGESDI